MRRDFRGKLCAYCAVRTAKTDDHIFAKNFFLERDRGNLPKAPCCRTCNAAKSSLEHYLLTVLPFGGKHAQAAENLKTAVPGRLQSNPKLAHNIRTTMEPAWLREGSGLYQRTSMMSFETGKLVGLLQFIGRGLTWCHFGIYLSQTDRVDVLFPADSQSAVLPALLRPENFPRTVNKSFGNDTVRYEGSQAREPLTLTMWRVLLYGGIALGDDGQRGSAEASSQWWIITGPTSALGH